MKTIHLNIIKSTVLDAVKSETYITGLKDKAVDGKANALAYQESAGDDMFHERKLERTLVTAAGKLSTLIGDYLSTDNQTTGDNSVEMDFSDTSMVKYKLIVSDRFNESYTDTLARLVSKFIEDQMLVLWWTPIKESSAALYQQFVNSDLEDIQRCFNKIAPKAPVYPYTTRLSVDRTNIEIDIPNGESFSDHTTSLFYEIDDNVIDDIEYRVLSGLVIVDKFKEGEFRLYPLCFGEATFVVYSRHKEAETRKYITVNVRKDDE